MKLLDAWTLTAITQGTQRNPEGWGLQVGLIQSLEVKDRLPGHRHPCHGIALAPLSAVTRRLYCGWTY